MFCLSPKIAKTQYGKMKQPNGKLLMFVGTYISKAYTSQKIASNPLLAFGFTNLRTPAVLRWNTYILTSFSFRDNCTCSCGRIQEDKVLDKVAVEWYSLPSTLRQGFFVRQTYLKNKKFESLKEEYKTCEHLKQRQKSVAQT